MAYYLSEKSNKSYLPVNGLSPLPHGLQGEGQMGRILWFSLLVIEVIIYSSYSILVHLCMVDGKVPFRSSSLVLCTEILKIFLSLIMIWPEVAAHKIKLPSFSVCLPFAVPAVLYCLNNNLGVLMQTHMDPTTYQILGNLKVVTTAVLYRLIMQKKLSGVQWFALALLAIAGMFDSYGGLQSKGGNWTGEIHVTMAGLSMMGVYCWVSGFAGVYTEYILKKQYQMSLHLQNLMLYVFGILCNGAVWLGQELSSNKTTENTSSLFEGFTVYTWVIIITQALNGLIMSVVMKHSSNITRLFIISCAMLVTTILSVTIFHLALNMFYGVAFVLVVVALYLYL